MGTVKPVDGRPIQCRRPRVELGRGGPVTLLDPETSVFGD